MNLKLKIPLAFFDLETTGINIANDRVVEISILKILPNGSEEKRTDLVNPGIPIPTETSLIHGIYDADVKDAPSFKDLAKSLAKFLEGCDLAGFNILRFDVPMIVEEFLRAGVNFDVSKRKLIDSQKIFHLMEKRNLSAAYKFYCNKTLENAHSAEADTLATYEILKRQLDIYDGREVEDMKGNKLGVIQNDMEVMHKITLQKMVDLAGRMVFNDKGEEVFNFGKHKGKRVVDILAKEPMYYDWIQKNDFSLDTKRKLTEIKLRQFNK
ncbi:MAG: 3'-5' exonuclease [Cyclobacteriaceae bacterium]|nr:3'-5' exonuclease [Cyclobacteriaceae bacterium]